MAVEKERVVLGLQRLFAVFEWDPLVTVPYSQMQKSPHDVVNGLLYLQHLELVSLVQTALAPELFPKQMLFCEAEHSCPELELLQLVFLWH